MDITKIAQALYTVNKEAKRLRDENHELFEQKRTLINELYNDNYNYGGHEVSLTKMYAVDPMSDCPISFSEYNDVLFWLECALNDENDEEVKLSKEKLQEYLEELEDSVSWIDHVKDEKHEEIRELNQMIEKNKEKIEEIYELKDDVIEKIRKENHPHTIEGYHYFPCMEDSLILIKFGGYSFHFLGDVTGDMKYLGNIEDEISSENTQDKEQKMSFEEAKEILKKFI